MTKIQSSDCDKGPEPIVGALSSSAGLSPVSPTLPEEEEEEGEEDMPATETTVIGAGMSHGSTIDSPAEQTDFEKYLEKSTQEIEQPPPPPPKDSPPISNKSYSDNNNNNNSTNTINNNKDDSNSTVESYFNPLGLTRTESIYSFSRVSFSNQLLQLTSIPLPQPSSLEASISAISTAPAAVRALTGANDQIQKWIDKASDVLGGLDAEDDVEWAAAAGREGLDDVDKAVTKFESLVNVYVTAIENVQLRSDISDVGPEHLTKIVIQMESTLKNWATVRGQLKGVKEQVELAMEWEELWSAVLGDVGLEIDNLGRLIFEMEEKRHKTMITEAENEPANGLDINELETIVEESPNAGSTPVNSRFSLVAPVFDNTPNSHLEVSTPQNSQDDKSLLALFARMQPLRASLDFLPMRLSMFQSRAEKVFPSACEELEDRRKRLEKGYKKLETDAEALRRELGEDRWILVFRNAGKQAKKMCDSVERSIVKLQEAIDDGLQNSNPGSLSKRVENFEAKRIHYGPAIERVMSIIQKGINDRLTVNGEIIRLHADLKAKSDSLHERMNAMESYLDGLNATRSQHMRDSISSIVTVDSPATRSAIDTPESSPASSVVVSAGKNANGVPTSHAPRVASRRGSATNSTAARPTISSKLKRYSGLPQPSPSSLNPSARRSSIPRASSNPNNLPPPPSPRISAPSPSPSRRPASRCSMTPVSTKPRWNSSANTNDLVIGHNYKPLSLTTPSPYQRESSSSRSRHSLTPSLRSSLPLPSPLSRESSASPVANRRPTSRLTSRLASPAPPISRGISPAAASPTPTRSSLLDPPPYSKRRKSPEPTSSSTTPTPTPSTTTTNYNYNYNYKPRKTTTSAAETLSSLNTSTLSNVPRSRQSYAGKPSVRATSVAPSDDGNSVSYDSTINNGEGGDHRRYSRPGTSLGHSRRTSMLPQPRGRSGRDSVIGGVGVGHISNGSGGGGGSRADGRPPWR